MPFFSNEDIKKALFDMNLFTTLGSEGFHMGFYQHMWIMVGKFIIDLASQFFETGILSVRSNDTLLVLIPKVQNLELVTQL